MFNESRSGMCVRVCQFRFAEVSVQSDRNYSVTFLKSKYLSLLDRSSWPLSSLASYQTYIFPSLAMCQVICGVSIPQCHPPTSQQLFRDPYSLHLSDSAQCPLYRSIRKKGKYSGVVFTETNASRRQLVDRSSSCFRGWVMERPWALTECWPTQDTQSRTTV